MNILQTFKERAAAKPKHIVLPEVDDDRTILAAARIAQERFAKLTLIGETEKIRQRASRLGVSLSNVSILDHRQSPDLERYAAELYHLMQPQTGMTLPEVRELILDPLYFGNMLVRHGKADGSVAGAVNTTAHTVRAALYAIGLQPGFSVVTSSVLVITQNPEVGVNGALLFADPAILIDPSASQLAEIAIGAAQTCRALLGVEPKVAMLSFSTKGSATHPAIRKVAEAVRTARVRAPELIIDGEMQADAALIPAIGESKAKGSQVAGHANVLVFPDLNSCNIGYKLVERLGNARAVGPILQGLNKPANDLSRGCSVEDIVDAVAITANSCIVE